MTTSKSGRSRTDWAELVRLVERAFAPVAIDPPPPGSLAVVADHVLDASDQFHVTSAETERQRCIRCRRPRPAKAFHSAALRKQVATCDECRAGGQARSDSWAERLGAEGMRDRNLQKNYGIGAAEYDALRERQNYRCAICGDHEDEIPIVKTGRPRKDGQPPAASFRLVVDHCHNTKAVRGLLCNRCNMAIGLLRESASHFAAAAAYLAGTSGPAGRRSPTRSAKVFDDPE